MTQPPLTPSPVDYQTPDSGPPSPHRQKAYRHALGNGVGFVALSLFLGAGATSTTGALSRIPVSPFAFLTITCFCLNAMTDFICGILYIIASFKIRRPNAFWEKTFFVTCALHLAIVLVLLLLIIVLTNDGRERYFELMGMLTAFFNLCAIIVLGHLLLLAIYTRWRCS